MNKICFRLLKFVYADLLYSTVVILPFVCLLIGLDETVNETVRAIAVGGFCFSIYWIFLPLLAGTGVGSYTYDEEAMEQIFTHIRDNNMSAHLTVFSIEKSLDRAMSSEQAELYPTTSVAQLRSPLLFIFLPLLVLAGAVSYPYLISFPFLKDLDVSWIVGMQLFWHGTIFVLKLFPENFFFLSRRLKKEGMRVFGGVLNSVESKRGLIL